MLKWKIQHYIFAITLVLVLAVLALTLESTYETYTDAIISQQQQRLLTVAESMSTNLELYIYEQIRDIEILVRTPGFISEMRAFYHSYSVDGVKEYILSYMLAHYMGISRIYLLDRNGKELFRYGVYPFLEEFDESLLEFERLSDMKRNGIGGIFEISPNSYGLSLVNIIYAGDEYLGCVVALADMDTLYSQFVEPLEFTESEYLMAKDERGTVIMHPKKEMLGFNYFTDLGALKDDARLLGITDMLEHQYAYESGTSLYRSFTNNILPSEEEICAYTRVNVTGTTLMISAAMPLSKALKPANDSLSRFGLLVTFIIAIVGTAIGVIYTLQKKRQRLAMQTRYLQDINNTLEELHQSREQVRHYQKLQTIGALAGGVVHEFNNLLTPIMGYCEFLLERLGTSSEYADDLQEIHKAGTRAKEIIEQILPFSRRESDTSAYAAVSVDAILHDAVKTVRLILPSSIDLEEDFEDTGINVFGSASQLNQVLLNLCTNAYQAMEQSGGQLRVGCKLVSRSLLPEKYRRDDMSGGYVMLSVEDTGTGMSQDIAERVFDAFFTTKKKGEGTGLGLSVVQNIVHDHNGFITLDTAPGKGARFDVYLQTTNAPVLAKAVPQEHAEQAPRSLAILVADDDPKIVRYLKNRLQRSGCDVDAHTFPESALAAFQAAPGFWDLVILDYTMPLYKGTDLARRMKKERPDLPIFLMTGLVEKEALQMKQEGIIDEIMIKPLNFQELLRAMMRI